MSEPLNRLANGAHCLCSNENPLRFRRFHDREKDEFLGLQCKICEEEYLKETFVKDLNRARHILKFGRDRFYLAEKVHVPEDSAHMVDLSRDKINVKLFQNYLKRGDHIEWKRPLGIVHHAIVTEMKKGNKIRVVHWHSNIGKNPGPECRIQEQWIVLEEEWGILYRVNYSEEIVKANPSRLVIARARSRKGEKGYNPITDNCETFASFCKCGVAISKQIRWAYKELKNECKKSGAKTLVAKVVFAEFTEKATSHEQWVGFSVLVVIEGIHTYIDVQDLWKARNEGKMTKKVAIEQITERITQAVLYGALAGFGGTFSYGILCGFIGGIIGKWFGSMVGPPVGQFIASLFEYDDRAICKITELQSADHLVLGYNGEGSHHCILQWYDETKNQINVIHNTEKDGVIQEWMDFIQPVYKVIYEEEDGPTAHEIWSKAVSMLGKKEYDAKTFNSKHFAQLCCKK